MKKISLIVGARPNFIKLFPVYTKLQNDYELTIIHTNQHYDYNMAGCFIETFQLKVIELDNTNINHANYIQLISNKIKDVLLIVNPDLVIVFGDVDSSLAGAIAANELNIKIAHVESGNRCYDQTMPEEINRIHIDKLSSYHFISEPYSINNLLTERIVDKTQENKTYFYVGNPMIDTLLYFKNQAVYQNKFYEEIGLEQNNYILITLHRQINVDIADNLKIILDSLEYLSRTYKIVFPLHPRTRKKILDLSLSLKNIIILEPLNYVDFLNLMINASIVITDGGGIQEETTFLNIPCVTLRTSTERPVTCILGTNILIKQLDKNHIIQTIVEHINVKKRI